MKPKLLIRSGGPMSENFAVVITAVIVVEIVCYAALRLFKPEMSEFAKRVISGIVTAVTGILLTLIFPPV